MSKRVPQSKRLQVIQKWINGRDDPEYEVFPCKKEGKYIVRPRKQPLIEDKSEDKSEEAKPIIEDNKIEQPKPIIEDNNIIEEQQPKISKPKPKTIIDEEQPKIYKPKSVYDPTINIEILNQLKLLGEEIKSEREKKEQKKMMKEVFHKEMNKQHKNFYQYTQPQYIEDSNQIEESDDGSSEEQITPRPQPKPQPIMRRRNNIFSDIIY